MKNSWWVEKLKAYVFSGGGGSKSGREGGGSRSVDGFGPFVTPLPVVFPLSDLQERCHTEFRTVFIPWNTFIEASLRLLVMFHRFTSPVAWPPAAIYWPLVPIVWNLDEIKIDIGELDLKKILCMHYLITMEPALRGHPRRMAGWPLYKGSTE